VENTRLHDRLADQRDEMCDLEQELADCRKENKGLLEKVAFAEETATRQFNEHMAELEASEWRVARLTEENGQLKASVAKLQKDIVHMVATASYSFQVYMFY
jgi:phage tail tape-measure protein